MKKVFTKFSEGMGVAPGTYRFLLDGEAINAEHTAGSLLDPEDEDENELKIECFLEQQGGTTK